MIRYLQASSWWPAEEKFRLGAWEPRAPPRRAVRRKPDLTSDVAIARRLTLSLLSVLAWRGNTNNRSCLNVRTGYILHEYTWHKFHHFLSNILHFSEESIGILIFKMNGFCFYSLVNFFFFTFLKFKKKYIYFSFIKLWLNFGLIF